jgi:type VI secretion system secreted protein VgrG
VAKFSQAGRFMSLTTQLGDDALLLETLTGTESLSALFRFDLGLLAPSATRVAFDRILGSNVVVKFPVGGGTRFVHGIVNRFAQGPEVRGGAGGDVTFVRYRAEVVPKLWLLGRQARSRTFQQLNVPDILRAVLAGVPTRYNLQTTYEKRDYVAQYRETDLAFAARLMEEEGIYYYFTHAADGHTMVIADNVAAHADVPVAAALLFDTIEGASRPEDRVTGWEKSQELRSGKVTLWDHSFELTGQNLEAVSPGLETVKVGTVDHKLVLPVNKDLEIYDYPGLYAQRFDGIDPGGAARAGDLSKIHQDKTRTAKLRMQQETAQAVKIDGVSSCKQLTAGHAFTLDRHPDGNGKYVVTHVRHTATLEGAYTGAENSAIGYNNAFECIPHALPYRPPPSVPRPVIHGTQTATVVGPSGQEIVTDKYARIKIQFPWDREGQRDQNSSCWVRVATSWAGQQWGAISLPRVGQEVVVAFEEGDPDRPIVVGSVYNDAMMPPYTLPDEKTKSTVKSRSSLNGTAENFNEIRFEDKKGSEEIYVHAEKDFNRVVENNDTHKIGYVKKAKGDQTVEVFNNQLVTVGGGKSDAADGSHTFTIWNNQTITVGSGKGTNKDGSQTLSVYKDRTATLETGNETVIVKQGKRLVQIDTGDDTHHVKTGNRFVNVDTGNDTHTVKTGNREVSVDTGNDTLTIKVGNQATKVSAGKSSLEAMQKIELKVGGSSIVIDQSGVTIKGMKVSVEAQLSAEVKGVMTKVDGSAMLQMKGGITMIG